MSTIQDGAPSVRASKRFAVRGGRLATAAVAMIGASVLALPWSSPASAVGTTITVTAVVNQQTADNGPAAWSTKNVTAASQGATVTFIATVTGPVTPVTGQISWTLSGSGTPTCFNGNTVAVLNASCVVTGALSPTLSATAAYIPGNDPAATSLTDTVTIKTPPLAPFTSGEPTTAPFTECPVVGDAAQGCNILLVLNAGGSATLLSNNKTPTLDDFDDTLVGILNETGIALPSVELMSPNTSNGEGESNDGIFAFDGDGLCSVSNTRSGNYAYTWYIAKKQLTPAQTGCPYGPTGYEGPFTYFSNYSAANHFTTGTVNFTQPGGLASGSSAFFSLESKVTVLTVPTTTTTTTLSAPGPVGIGTSISDTATVTGNTVVNTTPQGTVMFDLCPEFGSAPYAPCTTSSPGVITSAAVSVTPGTGITSTASSAPMFPNSVGTWCFNAFYGGAGLYSASSDAGQHEPANECFTTTPVALSSFTTQLSTASVGVPATDSATAVGNTVGLAPAGTVSFYLCGPTATSCDQSGQLLGTSNLSGTGDTSTATSPSWTPTTIGSYCYAAVYNPAPGGNYLGATSGATSECFQVSGLTLSKSASPSGTVAPGTVITYTLTAQNGAPTATKAFTVHDAVPAETTYVANSASCNGASGCTASQSAGTVSFSFTSLAASSPAQLTFQVLVQAGATQTISNVATFSGQNCVGTCSSNPVTNPVADLSVTKSTSPAGGVAIGQTITYTLDASNSGSAPASAVVTDQIPASTTYNNDAACPSNATPTTCGVSFDSGDSTITWMLSNVPSGTDYALTFSVTIPSTIVAGTKIANLGEWTGQGCVPTPPMTECPTNTVSNPVRGVPIIVTTPAGATAGSPTKDTALLTGDPADGTPGGTVTFFECGPAATVCTPSSGTQIGNPVSTQSAGSNTSSATSAPWTPSAPGSYCYAVLYTPSTSSPYLGGSASNPECFQIGQLSITKTNNPSGTVSPGQTITYSISAANTGGAASGSVTVTDAVPTGTSYVSGSASCNGAPGCTANETNASPATVTFTISSVAANSADVLTFSVTVNAGDTAPIMNTAGFTGPNCTASVNCTTGPPVVNQVADLTVAKQVSPTGPVALGTTLNYTLLATSIGSVGASATISDAVPAGTALVAGSDKCPSNATTSTCQVAVTGPPTAQVVTWTLTGVPSGTTYDLVFSAKPLATDTPGQVISNVGTWTGQGCIATPSAPSCSTNMVTNTISILVKPTMTTTPMGGNGTLASDMATVTGVAADGSPLGTVTFYECGPGVLSCSASGTSIGTINLAASTAVASTATSNPWNPAVQGSYCYATVYNPAPGSPYSTTTGPNECFTQGSI